MNSEWNVNCCWIWGNRRTAVNVVVKCHYQHRTTCANVRSTCSGSCFCIYIYISIIIAVVRIKKPTMTALSRWFWTRHHRTMMSYVLFFIQYIIQRRIVWLIIPIHHIFLGEDGCYRFLLLLWWGYNCIGAFLGSSCGSMSRCMYSDIILKRW
jgi:hypothetical protein